MCITELDIGGAEKAFVRIAIGLKALDWQVQVISLRDAGPMADVLKDNGISVTALHCRSFADVRAFTRLRRQLAAHTPDILLCFLHQANFYGRLAGKAAGVRHVVSGIRVADTRRWVILFDRLTRQLTSQYVAVSPSVAAKHARKCRIPAEQIISIPNGVEIPENIPPVDARIKGQILFAGRLCEQKAPQVAVSAFCQLPKSVQESATLLLAGDGPLRPRLHAMIREAGLEDRIQLLGHRNDLPTLMQQSSLLVLTSRWEGLPNVVLEAMAHGLPTICTAVDGVNDVVTDQRTGWLVPANDAQKLSTAIANALGDAAARRRISQNAFELVKSDFSWPRVVEQYDAMLQDLLDH